MDRRCNGSLRPTIYSGGSLSVGRDQSQQVVSHQRIIAQLNQIALADREIGRRIVQPVGLAVADRPDTHGGRRHDLHQPTRPDRRDGERLKVRFVPDHRVDKGWIHSETAGWPQQGQFELSQGGFGGVRLTCEVRPRTRRGRPPSPPGSANAPARLRSGIEPQGAQFGLGPISLADLEQRETAAASTGRHQRVHIRVADHRSRGRGHRQAGDDRVKGVAGDRAVKRVGFLRGAAQPRTRPPRSWVLSATRAIQNAEAARTQGCRLASQAPSNNDRAVARSFSRHAATPPESKRLHALNRRRAP